MFFPPTPDIKKRISMNEMVMEKNIINLNWLSKADSMFKDDASPCHIAVARVHVMTSGWVGRVALVAHKPGFKRTTTGFLTVHQLPS